MFSEKKVDEILDNLIASGSSIPYIKELKESSLREIKKDKSLKDVLRDISYDLEYYTQLFLERKNLYDTSLVSGLSMGIYLPGDSESSKYKYTIIGGNRSRNGEEKIDKDTVFDIASITKLYTLLLLFKLEELGLVSLDQRVSDINPDFKGLGDFTINDLVRLYGELRTVGNVAEASTYEEALERFKSTYLFSDDRTKNKYTDFGAMIIANTIEKIVSREFGKEMKFDEIMDKFLFKPLQIANTIFNPKTNNVSGNGYSRNVVHDPKSRKLGGVTGHAGIFTNSEDLDKLADGLMGGKFLNQNHLDKLSETTIKGSSRGNLGMYLKHPDGLKATFNPSELSDKSFTSQGFTGSQATFDLNNKIHNNILVNAVIEEDDKDKISNSKPKGYFDGIEEYQVELMKRIMLIYVVKKYYNKYCNVEEDVEISRSI